MVFGVMTFFATGFKPWKEEKVKRTCEPRQQYIPPVKHRGSVGITMQDYVSNKLDRQIDRERYIYIYISCQSKHTVGAIFDICRERPRAITAHSLQPELALFSFLFNTPEFGLFVQLFSSRI